MTQLRVFVDQAEGPTLAGTAYFTLGRKSVSTSFVYDSAYLSRSDAYALEPAFPLQTGEHYVDRLPGSFSDSAPDRWGRNLIDRQHRALGREATHKLPKATEVDYLTGSSDLTRQGNLRFAGRLTGPFLAHQRLVPPLVSLPHLLASADQVASNDDFAAVKALLDAGTGSLGGARPKASVQDGGGELMIAKFPHQEDEWDVMAWEKTALDLAETSGIPTPKRRLISIDGRSTLLLQRFDRVTNGGRVGYVSAMTLMGARDGEPRDYFDLAEALPEYGGRVRADLADLFARVAFNVAFHNTDDHLRNHGFLRSAGGWELSPMFDVNPNPDLRQDRVTGVAGVVDADHEVDALLDLAAECRLPRAAAREAIDRAITAVSTWRETAAANGISERGRDRFAATIENRLEALRRIA
ncbi:HipA domain-containing protein [soil metagenome]